MRRLIAACTIITALALAACGGREPASSEANPSATSAPPATAAAAVDDELERLKATTPVDACAWLTPEKLKSVLPDLEFEVVQRLEPRMSGYVWDSRCTYWAGRGTFEFAKETPTHTVEIFVATSATAAKAEERLAARREGAAASTGFTPQPSLGANAYMTSTTGVVMLHFVRDQSEVQVNYSDLSSPSEEKIRIVLALAASL
jgi:hypothetical protein